MSNQGSQHQRERSYDGRSAVACAQIVDKIKGDVIAPAEVVDGSGHYATTCTELIGEVQLVVVEPGLELLERRHRLRNWAISITILEHMKLDLFKKKSLF